MAQTGDVAFGFDMVNPSNANFRYAVIDGPIYHQSVYRFEKVNTPASPSGDGISMWKVNIPKPLSATPNWDIVLHHQNASGGAGAVLLTAEASVIGSGDSPAAMTLLVPNRLVGVGASGDKNVTVLDYATSAGHSAPGTMANDTSIGTGAWSNVNNAKVSDNSNATTDGLGLGGQSNYLVATNFGFSVPSTATIKGIEVRVEREKDGTRDDALDNAIRIVKGGAIGSTDRSTLNNWANSDEVVTFGGPSDLWGETWAPSDVNATNFGFAISGKDDPAGDGNASLGVDSITMKVYYTDSFDVPLPLAAGEALHLRLRRIPLNASGDSLTKGWDLILPPILRVNTE